MKNIKTIAMKNEYFCPTCSSPLSINNKIVLTVQNEKGDSGIIFLDTVLGEYTKIKHSSLKLIKGEKVNIFCPICHKNLLCIPDKNLAKLIMKDSDSENLTVLFSVLYGEEETYIVKNNKVEKKFGKHSMLDFESLSFYA